jgi:hypothetical protein
LFGLSGLFGLFGPSEITNPKAFHPVRFRYGTGPIHFHYPNEITEAFHGAGRASGINFFGFFGLVG